MAGRLPKPVDNGEQIGKVSPAKFLRILKLDARRADLEDAG